MASLSRSRKDRIKDESGIERVSEVGVVSSRYWNGEERGERIRDRERAREREREREREKIAGLSSSYRCMAPGAAVSPRLMSSRFEQLLLF